MTFTSQSVKGQMRRAESSGYRDSTPGFLGAGLAGTCAGEILGNFSAIQNAQCFTLHAEEPPSARIEETPRCVVQDGTPVSPQHRAQSGRGGPGPWPQEERQEKALLFLVRFHLHSLYLNVYHSEES